MENLIIKERLENLRALMEERNIDFCLFPTADYHNSEYVNDYFKVREYFSGFTGSNGSLLVWKSGAGLWTDGRYFIQAERELEGTGIDLYKMLNPGVPSIVDFLRTNLLENQTLYFDGRVININLGIELNDIVNLKEARLVYDLDLSAMLWEDRPAFPEGKVYLLDEKISGINSTEKIKSVRNKLKELKSDSIFISKLDDIMWLFNIRGCDVKRNPVALSFAYISMDEVCIFIQRKCLNNELLTYFSGLNINVYDYDETLYFVKNISDKNIVLDSRYVSYIVYKSMAEKNSIVFAYNPTEIMKAKKNSVEITNMKRVYLEDSLALTRFAFWLKTNVGKIPMTEISASDYLENLRRQIPGFIDLSFDTIAGYNANAAMMHYKATEDNNAVIEPSGMLLVDSGGQYMGGTTDVTRTFILGPISDEMKKHYTLVAAAMLDMTNAHWLYGCSGRSLDIIARKPLWDIGIDYQCGTGHGVGYILNVHEGPQNMRWRYSDGMIEVPFEAGMDITNEPGVYIEGSHGIRIENVLIACNDIVNEYGQFMHFETLTFVPLDPDGIDVKYFSDVQLAEYNKYQKEVYERLSPGLNEAELFWLKNQTRELKK